MATRDETKSQFGERWERVLRRFIEVPQDAGSSNAPKITEVASGMECSDRGDWMHANVAQSADLTEY